MVRSEVTLIGLKRTAFLAIIVSDYPLHDYGLPLLIVLMAPV